MTRVTELLSGIQKSSWLCLMTAVFEIDIQSWMISFNPQDYGLTRTIEDNVYIVQYNDRLDAISQVFYSSPNYAPLLFLLNDNIDHPLILNPGIQLWIPSQSKVFNLIRNAALSETS